MEIVPVPLALTKKHLRRQVNQLPEELMSDKPATITEDDVRTALRQVVDPEIGMDVIQLGLIRELDMKADSTHVQMLLTTPFCPYGPQLMEQVRRTVQEATGV